MPQLVIFVAVAHHGEHQVLEDGLEVGADELPGCRMVNTGRREHGKAPSKQSNVHRPLTGR